MKTIRTIGLLALLAASARGDDWSQLGRDLGRSRLPSESLTTPSLLGSVASGAPTASSPVASDGYLVTAGLDGSVRALREDDRSTAWSVSVGSGVISTPLVDRGRIFLACSDGVLRILRLADGASLGSVETGGANHASPVLSGSILYQATGFPVPSLLAIDTVTRTVSWSAPLDQVAYASPAVAGGKVLIATNNGTLSAFDALSGAPVWSTNIGGSGGASSPLVLGSSVFYLSEGTLTRLDLDSGAISGAAPMAADAAPANALSLQFACSSLALVNGRILGLLRFEYALDDNSDGYVDAWTLREFAFAADPATLVPFWQSPLGAVDHGTLNDIPPYGLVPSPVSMGAGSVFASSLDQKLRFVSPAGATNSAYDMDGPCLASPMLANARIYGLSRAGYLYAFEDTAVPQPAPATGLTPNGVELATTPPTLSWSGAGATYVVRLAQDGDLLMDWDFETVVGGTSIACPPLADGVLYTWGVRVRSATGAYSPWSTATFGQLTPPLPPGAITAQPGNRSVQLTWGASPSASVNAYRLRISPTAGGAASVVDLGAVTTTTVGGLTGGVSYTFELRAVDFLGFASGPVTATATPLALITIGGAQYDTIAAALAAALPGETVLLGAGTFTINAPLQVPAGVELRGANARDTQIVASGLFLMVQALQGSSIRGLSLSGGSLGVKADGAGVTIQNCVIRDMSDAGIEVQGTAQVINNTIVGNAVAGLRASGRADARNNIVQGNGVGFQGIVVSSYNDVTDGYVVCVAAPSDLNAAVAFLNAGAGDYREQPFQPSLDAGAPSDDYSQEPALNGGRINLGAFGNTALAATSLTAGPPPPVSSPPKSSSGGGCGLLGLEALIALVLLRRRR